MSWAEPREVTTATGGTAATSRTYTLGASASSIAVGNLLIVFAGMVGGTVLGSPFISSSTANAGALGAWTVGLNTHGGGGASALAACYAVVNGALTSADTITLTFTATAAPAVVVAEFSTDGTITAAANDQTASTATFGNATYNSGNTAALTSANDLVLGVVSFDNGTGTNTITPEVLSPAWQAGPTTVQTSTGTGRIAYRWRDPVATTAVRMQGVASGAASDWTAGVLAIKVTAGFSGSSSASGPGRAGMFTPQLQPAGWF